MRLIFVDCFGHLEPDSRCDARSDEDIKLEARRRNKSLGDSGDDLAGCWITAPETTE